MQAQIHELTQGSDAWCQFRLEHFGASEAAAMLGLSTKVKRTELLHMKHTSLPKEFAAWVRENILDHGHVVEALARPLVEEIIGDDLYPITCSVGVMSASLDGLTMSEQIAFEHKQWNTTLAASVAAGELPEEYQPQCQQILLVTGAEKVVFTVSDGTMDNLVHMDVFPDGEWFERIRAGWDQFAIDLEEYVPRQLAEKPVAEAIMALPALVVQIRGEVANSNLPAFKEAAERFIANIKTDLQNDEDFANAEATVRFCDAAEKNLELTKAAAIAQTASIDDLMRTVDLIKDQLRAKRLMLTKLVDKRKIEIKETILAEAKLAYAEHVAALEVEIKPIRLAHSTPDFAGAMKNKRTLASLHDAVDTMLAAAKITTNATASDYRAKQAWCREHAQGYQFLLMDLQQIISKPQDDFELVVTTRIADHKRAEEVKAEALRAQIAAEEKAKAEAAAKIKADADEKERLRIAAEAERVANEQAAIALAEQNRLAAEAAVQRRAASAAAANVIANAAAAPVSTVPAGAAPEIARTAGFYGENSASAPARATELQALADQNLGDKRAMASASRMTGVPVTTRAYPVAGAVPAALLDAADAEQHPTDEEIIELGGDFGLAPAEWLARLEHFVAAAHAGQIAIAA